MGKRSRKPCMEQWRPKEGVESLSGELILELRFGP